MKVKNKKIGHTIIGIAAVILVTIGITYAYWLITKSQTGENLITSACLDISLTNEENDITLTNQFPLSDANGMKLTPYTFTVTNNCNTSVDYQIALETFKGADTISSSAIKVMIDSDTPMILSTSEELETRIANATKAYLLKYGTLTSKNTEGSSATHTLRLWIDENAPISEMKKTLISKISVTIGQGITKPKETLAYDILSNYGGNVAITEIASVWSESEYGEEENVSIFDTNNTEKIYFGTSYEWDNNTGKYKLSGNIVNATITECRETSSLCGEYTFFSTDQSTSLTEIYKVESFVGSQNDSGPSIYLNAKKKSAVNNYDINAQSAPEGLYKTEDDLGTSYYFKGDITDNYVQLGVWKETTLKYMAIGPGDKYDSLEECETAWSTMGVTCVEFGGEKGNPMYWRIVRINGDGSVRLIYDGTSPVENGVSHNAIINHVQNIPLNYGSSSIKDIMDDWYTTNLKDDFEKYLADGIFCNDNNIAYYLGPQGDMLKNGSTQYFDYFEAKLRLDNKAPKLKCSNKADRYTVNDTSNGNGLLTNPIGLITADEAFLASNGSYIYSNYASEYTMTPSWYESGISVVYALGSNSLSSIISASFGSVDYLNGIRPVINLKENVPFSYKNIDTAGTIDDPYIIAAN